MNLIAAVDKNWAISNGISTVISSAASTVKLPFKSLLIFCIIFISVPVITKTCINIPLSDTAQMARLSCKSSFYTPA